MGSDALLMSPKEFADFVASETTKWGDIARATGDLVMKELPEWKSGAGLVAVDRHGNIAMPFNTEGMYRGSVSSSSPVYVAIYE